MFQISVSNFGTGTILLLRLLSLVSEKVFSVTLFRFFEKRRFFADLVVCKRLARTSGPCISLVLPLYVLKTVGNCNCSLSQVCIQCIDGIDCGDDIRYR
jgi:hypothetical protein